MRMTGQHFVVSARLSADARRKVEAFAARNKLNRSEAISFLIGLGLKTASKAPDETTARERPLPRQSFT
jgi:hypothetical protein